MPARGHPVSRTHPPGCLKSAQFSACCSPGCRLATLDWEVGLVEIACSGGSPSHPLLFPLFFADLWYTRVFHITASLKNKRACFLSIHVA